MAETVDALLYWARDKTENQVDFPGVTKLSRALTVRKDFICDKLKGNGRFQHVLDMIPSVDLKKNSEWKAVFVPNELGPYIQKYKRKREMNKPGSDAIENKLAYEGSKVPELPAMGTELHQARPTINTLHDAELALNDVLQFLKTLGGETGEVQHELQPQELHIPGKLSAFKTTPCLQSCDACKKRTTECPTEDSSFEEDQLIEDFLK